MTHEVIIAGGGPTGLALAAELALAKVDVAIVERRTTQDLVGLRAGGLHARTIEMLDQRGVADRFVSQGQKHPALGFNMTFLKIGDQPTRHNYVLALRQNLIEPILAEWADELNVRIYRGRDVTGFTQDDSGVDVVTSDGVLRAQYLVGCDGGRSTIRKLAGIDFPGWDATTSWLIVEADFTEEPAWGFREHNGRTHAIGKIDDGKRMGAVLTEPEVGRTDAPTLRDISAALTEVYGTDFGIHNPTWISRFTDMARQAAAYRDRRVLLAGDAAHVHAPVGGQGLNIGVQDAMNLGWKLAQVVKTTSPESLLDTYHAERHPVAARVLRNTMAQIALRRPDDHTKALAGYVTQFLGMDEPRKHLVAEMSGLDVHYDLGEGHPLLGRRMPDLDVVIAGSAVRVYTLLHEARPVLINFGKPGSIEIPEWSHRVNRVDAEYSGKWELPAIGEVEAPGAVLIRPDGYVAWVGDESQTGLVDALTKWFGEATV